MAAARRAPFWHTSGLPFRPQALGDHRPRNHGPGPTIDIVDRVRHFLHVLIEPRSYLNAIYLLTAFPLGLTYFFVLTAGTVSGALLSLLPPRPARPPPPVRGAARVF